MYARHYMKCFTHSLLFNRILLTLYLSRNQSSERSQDLPKVTQEDVAEPKARSCSVPVQIPCSVSCDTIMEMVYQLCIVSIMPVCKCSGNKFYIDSFCRRGKKKERKEIETEEGVKFRWKYETKGNPHFTLISFLASILYYYLF